MKKRLSISDTRVKPCIVIEMTIIVKRCHGNCGQTLRAKFKIFMIFFLLRIELLVDCCQHLDYDSIGNLLRILPGKDIG